MYPKRRKVGVLSKFLTGNPTEKIPLGRPTLRWDDK